VSAKKEQMMRGGREERGESELHVYHTFVTLTGTCVASALAFGTGDSGLATTTSISNHIYYCREKSGNHKPITTPCRYTALFQTHLLNTIHRPALLTATWELGCTTGTNREVLLLSGRIDEAKLALSKSEQTDSQTDRQTDRQTDTYHQPSIIIHHSQHIFDSLLWCHSRASRAEQSRAEQSRARLQVQFKPNTQQPTSS